MAVNKTMDGDFVFAKSEKPAEVIELSQAKPGDVFLTRGGGVAEYVGSLANFRKSSELLHVLAIDSQTLVVLPSNGRLMQSTESEIDIVAKKPQKRVLDVWMNIKSNGQLWDYPSRFDADQNASSDRIACVPLRIEYTEGEGL